MSKKVLIVYKSKTGFTEQYARWISEVLPGECELVPYSKRKSVRPGDYECVVYGGFFYAGKVSGLEWLKSILPELHDKKAAVFVTGAMPPELPESANALEQNFTGAGMERLKVFYLHSGLRYEKMGPVDKTLMAAFRGMVKKSSGEDSEMYKTVSKSFDCTSKEAIAPVVEFISAV